MNVIGAMTVAATSVDGFDLVQRHSMTVVTADIDMSTLKRDIGLCVVIESPNVPGNGVVACGALFLEVAAMGVVITVTGYAATLFTCECLRSVASLALLITVYAE